MLLSALISQSSVDAQIVYTRAFTQRLVEAGLEYDLPAEQWLHVIMPPDDSLMHYDLVLQNDRNDFELRFHIHSASDADLVVPASVALTRLVATIASNDENALIRIEIPPEDLLKTAFNADRGAIALFSPKKIFSEKQYGALISLYSVGRQSVDIVILYNDPAYDPLTAFRSLRYQD